MSLPVDQPATTDERPAVAIAVVAAGGLLLPLPGLAGLAVAAVLLAALLFAALRFVGPDSPTIGPGLGVRAGLEAIGLATLLAVLVRALARLLIATPALTLALPLALLAGWIPRIQSPRVRWAAAIALAGLMIGAGSVGLVVEANGPQPRGMVRSGPLLGVHPRQAVAVTIDGFGPHDVIADDHVEPDGSQGHDPASWAERLEFEIRAIAELHYAEGPARAREAFARAEVELASPVIAPHERGRYPVEVGVEVRSGTSGEGSRVEFGCPGRVIDPRAGPVSPVADCPRKYARDGSTGLGLSPRWAGYTEFRGRDRLRLARLLGWPSGAPAIDRRTLTIEFAAIGLAILILVLSLTLTVGRTGQRATSEPAIVGLIALVGIALLHPSSAIEGQAVEAGVVLPLAVMLALVGRPRAKPNNPTRARPVVGLVVAGLIVCLGLSGLAGQPRLEVALTELLVVDAGASWAGAGASWAGARLLASVLAMLMIVPGTLACARMLLGREQSSAASPQEIRSVRVSRAGRVALALALALGLVMRKPEGDAALFASATALVLACALAPDQPNWRRWSATAGLAGAAGFALLGPGPRDPGAVGLAVAGVLLTLLAGVLPARLRLEP